MEKVVIKKFLMIGKVNERVVVIEKLMFEGFTRGYDDYGVLQRKSVSCFSLSIGNLLILAIR